MTIDTSDGHPAMDYDEHVKTFHGFWFGAQIIVAVAAAILIGMYIFLV